MGKIIEFPSGKVIDKPRDETEILNEYLCEAVDVAQHLILTMSDEIERLIEEDGIDWLQGFNMRDEEYPEARDAHVLVNIMHTMFVRYLGLDHRLQKDADSFYIKLKALELKDRMGEPEEDDIT
jgi:hypothetical protein